MTDYGPTLRISQEIDKEKYRMKGEGFKEACTRVAEATKDSDDCFRNFRQMLLEQRFLPAGRILAAMGAPRAVTPFNCLGGDTQVITNIGIKTLHQLSKQDKVTLLDGDGKWVDVKVYSHGTGDTLKVRLTNGRKVCHVVATKDHEWVIEGQTGRVQTSDLKKGMRIPHATNWCESDKKAVLHGLVYGDGTKTKDNGFVIHVCAEHEATYPVLDEFDLPFSETERGRLYYMFGKNATTEYKELPSAEATDEYIAGFIRGLFLADGCLSAQPEYIITGTAELQEWLEDNGPVGGFYVTGSSKLQEETNFGFRTRPTYNIRFDLRSINQGDCLKGTLDFETTEGWRVAGIEENGVEQVYCPSVPTTKSFVLANGAVMGNCFVSGTIEDSMDGITDKLKEAAQTMRLGGGIGYDFSTLRPRGSLIKSLDSHSAGPLPFMNVFDAMCGTIQSAGHRRGAQMGILRVDHPDIEEFVRSKQNSTNLRNFNISIGVTDKFMEAVRNDDSFELVFKGVVFKEVRARYLWDEILRSTYDWAEPGVVFIDWMNRKNNLWYCETISATNPCAEQPLPPYGACLLGSFNLTKYVKEEAEGYTFDYSKFKHDIPYAVRALDNVVDRAVYPLEQQAEEAKNKRRIGIGVTGLANTIEAMGHPYGSKGFLEVMEEIFICLRDTAYRASISLSIEKGPFPKYDRLLLESGFAKTLPEDIREFIGKYGLRNSHLLSIAPTGTISLRADNVSSGIEPVFSLSYTRDIFMSDGMVTEVVEDYGKRVFGVSGRVSKDVTVSEHVAVLCLASRYVDSACSKTCNVPEDVKWEEFKSVYWDAYNGGASGCTTFRDNSKRVGILKASKDEEVVEVLDGTACYIDSETGLKSCE